MIEAVLAVVSVMIIGSCGFLLGAWYATEHLVRALRRAVRDGLLTREVAMLVVDLIAREEEGRTR